jgi:hypothetical protein
VGSAWRAGYLPVVCAYPPVPGVQEGAQATGGDAVIGRTYLERGYTWRDPHDGHPYAPPIPADDVERVLKAIRSPLS